MDEAPENPQRPLIDAEIALRNAQRLLSTRTPVQNEEPLTIRATSQGMVPLDDSVELIQRLEQLPLASASAGDVVWWLTQTGTRGLFAIEEPYQDPGTGLNEMKTGKGKFLVSRSPGQHLGDQTGEGSIRGASLGSMLKVNTLVKGMSVEYTLTSGERTKLYTSTPVVEMGIIKSGSLSQA